MKNSKMKSVLNKPLVYLKSQGALIALLLMIIVASIVFDSFFTFLNLTNILRQVSMIGLVSIGMTFVILTGGIDLSVGSTAALAAVVAANFSDKIVILPVFLPVLIGAGVGFLNGIIITKIKLTS